MSFRLRPSSKKSTDTQNSLVEFPKPQTFISNEVMNLKHMINKVEILQNSVNILTEGIRRQREISSAGYIEVQKRLDLLEYKSFANQKDIQQLVDINRGSYNQLPPLKKQSTQSLSKNEMTILKQTLLQQRQSQKQQSKHMSQTLEQLSIKQLRLQQQLREMFNRTRTEYEDRMSQQTQDLQKVDQFKMRKIDNQYELMRENMQVMERRIVQELQTKIRKQMLIKEYVQEQINLAKQELMEEQRSFVSTEVKLTREFKQSLESLYAMIGQMKATFGEELSETQQLTSNNIKRLAMNLDVIDGKYQERLKQVEQGVNQTEKEMVNFRQWIVSKLDENREIVMGLEEQAIQRIQNSKGLSNTQQGSYSQSAFASEERFKHFQNQLQSWKSSIQQKNLLIFKQISQTLKQIKLEYKKQNDQVSSELISLTQSLKQLKKSLPNDMKKISQTLVTIFNDEFDVLAQELDLMTQMIKVAKNEGETFTKNEIKKHKEEFVQQIKQLIQSGRKQVTLGFQKSIIKSGESFKTSLQKESQFIQSLFNQRLQRLQATTQQMQTQSKKLNTNTSAQLQNFTLSMKQFNENYKEYLEQQRKQDLKKRIELEQNMRKNASNLMDIAYKKSEFLVQGMKKAIEMNEMKKDLQTKQAIEGVKDDLSRANQQQKQQLFSQLRSLEQKLENERKKSEQQLQDELKQSISTLKKTLGIQMGNTKLQIDEKMRGLQKDVEERLMKERENSKKIEDMLALVKRQIIQNQQKAKKSQQKLEQVSRQSQQKLEQVKKQLLQGAQKLHHSQKQQTSTKLNQIQKKLQSLQKTISEQTKVQLTSFTQRQNEMQQKQQQFQTLYKALRQQIEVQKVKQKQSSGTKLEQLKSQVRQEVQRRFEESAQKLQQSLKENEQTLNTLRETVWKLQAMNFSEQAKNKAILDKINDDLNHITLDLDRVSKEIKTQHDKSKSIQPK